jgi:hypothetical protein
MNSWMTPELLLKRLEDIAEGFGSCEQLCDHIYQDFDAKLASLRARLELAMKVVEAARAYCADDLPVKTGTDVFDSDITVSCYNELYVRLIKALRELDGEG